MVSRYTFKNGLRFIYEKPISVLPVTSVQVLCDYGSVYENDDVRGAAHFIEHMCFKGTSKIPDAKDIFLNYNKIGAYFNAETYKRYTRYYVLCEDDYVKNSIHILSDMLMNSTFNKKEFQKEENVVIEENIRSKDSASRGINNDINKIIYKGSSYENPVDDITYHEGKQFHYEDIVEIYKMFYIPSRMVVSVVSNLSFATIKEMINESFFSKQSKKLAIDLNTYEKYQKKISYIPYDKIQYNINKKKELSTMHVNIGIRICNYYSPDAYPLILLCDIIGGNTSGRLYNLLREKNGLTYSSGTDTFFYEHLGDLTFFIQTDPNKFIHNGDKKGVLPLVIQLINDLIKDGITSEELKTIKSNFKGRFSLNLQYNDNFAFRNGLDELMGLEKIIPVKDSYEKFYANITVKEVNNMIKKYFKKENITVCILANKVPSLETVKNECEKIIEK